MKPEYPSCKVDNCSRNVIRYPTGWTHQGHSCNTTTTIRERTNITQWNIGGGTHQHRLIVEVGLSSERQCLLLITSVLPGAVVMLCGVIMKN